MKKPGLSNKVTCPKLGSKWWREDAETLDQMTQGPSEWPHLTKHNKKHQTAKQSFPLLSLHP